MSENSERWQDYPYLVEWVAELNAWGFLQPKLIELWSKICKGK